MSNYDPMSMEGQRAALEAGLYGAPKINNAEQNENNVVPTPAKVIPQEQKTEKDMEDRMAALRAKLYGGPITNTGKNMIDDMTRLEAKPLAAPDKDAEENVNNVALTPAKVISDEEKSPASRRYSLPSYSSLSFSEESEPEYESTTDASRAHSNENKATSSTTPPPTTIPSNEWKATSSTTPPKTSIPRSKTKIPDASQLLNACAAREARFSTTPKQPITGEKRIIKWVPFGTATVQATTPEPATKKMKITGGNSKPSVGTAAPPTKEEDPFLKNMQREQAALLQKAKADAAVAFRSAATNAALSKLEEKLNEIGNKTPLTQKEEADLHFLYRKLLVARGEKSIKFGKVSRSQMREEIAKVKNSLRSAATLAAIGKFEKRHAELRNNIKLSKAEERELDALYYQVRKAWGGPPYMWNIKHSMFKTTSDMTSEIAKVKKVLQAASPAQPNNSSTKEAMDKKSSATTDPVTKTTPKQVSSSASSKTPPSTIVGDDKKILQAQCAAREARFANDTPIKPQQSAASSSKAPPTTSTEAKKVLTEEKIPRIFLVNRKPAMTHMDGRREFIMKNVIGMRSIHMQHIQRLKIRHGKISARVSVEWPVLLCDSNDKKCLAIHVMFKKPKDRLFVEIPNVTKFLNEHILIPDWKWEDLSKFAFKYAYETPDFEAILKRVRFTKNAAAGSASSSTADALHQLLHLPACASTASASSRKVSSSEKEKTAGNGSQPPAAVNSDKSSSSNQISAPTPASATPKKATHSDAQEFGKDSAAVPAATKLVPNVSMDKSSSPAQATSSPSLALKRTLAKDVVGKFTDPLFQKVAQQLIDYKENHIQRLKNQLSAQKPDEDELKRLQEELVTQRAIEVDLRAQLSEIQSLKDQLALQQSQEAEIKNLKAQLSNQQKIEAGLRTELYVQTKLAERATTLAEQSISRMQMYDKIMADRK